MIQSWPVFVIVCCWGPCAPCGGCFSRLKLVMAVNCLKMVHGSFFHDESHRPFQWLVNSTVERNGISRPLFFSFFFPETMLDHKNLNFGIPNQKSKFLYKELENGGVFNCILSWVLVAIPFLLRQAIFCYFVTVC